jgi:Glu-tRNA(Gln) amidotransferase subunit E-like FAD-binding protein
MDNFQEDNIRTPDAVISEQLMEDNMSDFEKQLDEAMYLSMQEMEQQYDINRQYEEQLLKDYYTETNRRNELFKEFLFNLSKIGKIDKEIRVIYEILDPIIESYCGQYIKTYELDETSYDKIFNTLKKIRNNQQAFDTLKTIILKEDYLP